MASFDDEMHETAQGASRCVRLFRILQQAGAAETHADNCYMINMCMLTISLHLAKSTCRLISFAASYRQATQCE